MAKIAVIFYGPPGAGKGTQANLLTGRKGFTHFDTGRYLEQLVHDPSNKKNRIIQREGKLFDSGALMTPSFVLKVTANKAKEIARAGFNIVFSGSPRTMFEAFGDNKHTGLVRVLEKAYGKQNIYPVFLDIDPNASIKRNKYRMVCSVCATAVLYSDALHKHKTCPLCGGKLIKRTVDNPSVFKTRIKEYQERTFPILAGLKKRGYKITKVNGMPLPFKVHASVAKKLKL
ncbi:MAG: nucleoside monophosphate kinase [bacterium]|nr:nucleoside monophosphate kinase [bacterium]